MERLKISENRHYFIKESGEPFFWLADTAWTLPQRMKWDDVDYYMEKRRAQGFTALQIVALDPEQDVQMRSPAGDRALIKDDLLTPNENYFRYLDYVLDRAESYGFYVLLLPVWGQLVTGDNWGNKTFNKLVDVSNAYAFGEWIGHRYQNRKNILWCLGGDRHPIHKGVDYRPVWRKMAEGLIKGHPDVVPLITYHTCYDMHTGRCSTSDDFTKDDTWISFTMIQSGHSESAENFKVIAEEYNRIPIRPVFDGEPAYEKMPTCWPPKENAFHEAGIVRRRAYWAIFSGTFGHTYGHSSVWCMISEKQRSSFRPFSWYEALEQEGAKQMRYLRDLADSRPWQNLIPCQQLIGHVCSAQCYSEHRQACITKEKNLGFVYFPHGGKEQIDLALFDSDKLQFWWWNPRDGKCFTQDLKETSQPYLTLDRAKDIVSVQTPESGEDIDWVLVIEDVAAVFKTTVPGVAIWDDCTAGKSAQDEKVFDW